MPKIDIQVTIINGMITNCKFYKARLCTKNHDALELQCLRAKQRKLVKFHVASCENNAERCSPTIPDRMIPCLLGIIHYQQP